MSVCHDVPWYHQDGSTCVRSTGRLIPDVCPTRGERVFPSPEAAAVTRVRALHVKQDKPVRSYGPEGCCPAHAPVLGQVPSSYFAAMRDCPDCRYTEYWVCSHCECPNDEWPCPTIRALGDVFG